MRLIDADALIEVMEDTDSWLLYDDWGNQTVTKDLIDNAPTIDAVEVVRCKDCKHWNSETKGCKRNPSVEAWEETDFCSYGERKTD